MMAEWRRDDARTRESMRPWAYWMLYRTGLFLVEWHGVGTFRNRWRWQRA